MKKLLTAIAILLLVATAYAGIRPMSGVLELGRGGMQIVQTVIDASATSYWHTAMTDRWDTAMTALLDTTMDTEVP